jgi:hypothetical protein
VLARRLALGVRSHRKVSLAFPIAVTTERLLGVNFIEYFAAHIRNSNTRRAHFHAVLEFSRWCEVQNFTRDRRY